jgi:hypothetical protein
VAGAFGGHAAPVIAAEWVPAATGGCGSGAEGGREEMASAGGCGAMKGLVSTGAVAAGEVMVAPHWGQGPDTPAISPGTVSKMPQDWQLK